MGQIAITLIFSMPWLWGLALVVGLVWVWRGAGEKGWGTVLGGLAGAVVGFSLCTGIVFAPEVL